MKNQNNSTNTSLIDTTAQIRKSWIWHVWVFTRRRPLGAFGGFVLLVLVFMAIFAPIVTVFDPIQQDIPNRLRAPNSEFWFGTDTLGQDQFSRIIYGARVSLFVGLMSVISASAIGALTGVASAYFGGRFDLGVQRVVDALQGIPGLVLVLALVMALGASLNNVTIAIGIGLLARLVRIARSQALSVKEQDFVLAARAIGASDLRIILRHVALNSLTPVILVSAGLLGNAIVTEASLSFLGLGVPPPHPSWGRMLQAGSRGYMEAAPWLVIFPGIALTLTVFGFNLFGDAIRDHLDPRLRGN